MVGHRRGLCDLVTQREIAVFLKEHEARSVARSVAITDGIGGAGFEPVPSCLIGH